MIISRIDGGLGNQMFQYAYGLYLARRHRTELWLDLSSYEKQPQHGYLLDQFQIEAKPVPEALLGSIPRRYRTSSKRISAWRDCFGWHALRRYKERAFGFDEANCRVANNRYVVGYWQSEKNFPGLRQELTQQFELRNAVSEKTRELGRQMRSSSSLAVHVRRGDYIHNQAAAKIYEHLSSDYYRSCVRNWATAVRNAEIYIFSNDIEWCRREFQFPWKTHFVDHTSNTSAFEDLWLMQQAACLVMANSTFSWWAAWLNSRPDATIIAPSRWFQAGVMDGSHILCDHWQIANVDVRRCEAAAA